MFHEHNLFDEINTTTQIAYSLHYCYIPNIGLVYVFMNIGNVIMNSTYLSYLFVRAIVEKTLNLIQFCSLYSGDDDYVKISQFFIFHIAERPKSHVFNKSSLP
jgi:hypothetical protein